MAMPFALRVHGANCPARTVRRTAITRRCVDHHRASIGLTPAISRTAVRPLAYRDRGGGPLTTRQIELTELAGHLGLERGGTRRVRVERAPQHSCRRRLCRVAPVAITAASSAAALGWRPDPNSDTVCSSDAALADPHAQAVEAAAEPPARRLTSLVAILSQFGAAQIRRILHATCRDRWL